MSGDSGEDDSRNGPVNQSEGGCDETREGHLANRGKGKYAVVVDCQHEAGEVEESREYVKGRAI